jgi:bacterial/archaeal transporter family-2 protein
MKGLFFIALLLGSMVVFQPLLNRMILEHKGLGFAALLNGSVVFVSTASLWLFMLSLPQKTPAILHQRPDGPFHWWFLLPGFLGFLLIITTPIMIKHLGAFTTVLAMILGQVITSLCLDALTQNIAINPSRIAGLALAMAGAYLSFKPSGLP